MQNITRQCQPAENGLAARSRGGGAGGGACSPEFAQRNINGNDTLAPDRGERGGGRDGAARADDGVLARGIETKVTTERGPTRSQAHARHARCGKGHTTTAARSKGGRVHACHMHARPGPAPGMATLQLAHQAPQGCARGRPEHMRQENRWPCREKLGAPSQSPREGAAGA